MPKKIKTRYSDHALINVTRQSDHNFVPSLPGIVRQIVSKIPSYVDNSILSDEVWRVDDLPGLDELTSLIDNPNRHFPVLVLADSIGRPIFSDPDVLARRLSGAAHVISLSSDAAWGLTKRIGRPLSVYDGAARIYRAGFQSDRSDPYDHPLLLPRSDSNIHNRTDALSSRVLAETVNTARGDYPRFNVIREAVAANAIKARRATATDTDLSQLFEEENTRLTDELHSVRNEFGQWLDDAEQYRNDRERELAELRSELSRARAQNDFLRTALANGQTSKSRELLTDLGDFGTWARNNLSTNIWISSKAIKETEKNGIFENTTLLGDALFMLDDLYVEMRKDPGYHRRAAYEARLVELNLADNPCFGDNNSVKSFPEYSVVYQSERYWCDHHIKFGGGTDPRRFFRIYYHWHDSDQILLIGHMPTHLDNKLTN